ncbi:Acg family FMN-binding oxidoreductase [Vibrio mangrovi]|uniref:Nitroreductase family protein n=1 Tax=Vibrio mangrovi TaxID=474394 RepID=A0A1Y6INA6_9VIBR|nr:nitroreductase family protein [Vibrio mangrovi]MDW6004075.1 nitroreductase family protein [Vibrio mangrovi]SMR99127.1 Putative NAD(P)H nitroreductase acg [Vibrio mangrovi]
MNRRQFIRVIGAGTVIFAASSLMIEQFSSGNRQALRPPLKHSDLRETLLGYAMLCPNPHNKQPWKVAFIGKNVIRLYVDEERLLPQTDPVYRQIHIGQGTFIETLVIAASQFGIWAEVVYFPLGEYDNQSLEALPVADITLIPDTHIQPDKLFSQLLTRQSTKTPYSDESFDTALLAEVLDVVQEEQFGLNMIHREQDRAAMRNYLTQAMEIEESDHRRSLETIAMFRFNDQELAEYRDGFGLEQNGIVGVKRKLAETFFISREKAETDPEAFGRESVQQVRKIVANTPYYVLLSSHDNQRTTQLRIGRVYQRINLLVNSLGLAMHPMSQILQEYDDMLTLQDEFKQHFGISHSDTVQMLFRLGKAEATPLTPRREIGAIII